MSAGLRQTDLGYLPVDWRILQLSEMTSTVRPITYGIVQTGPRVSNGVRCLRVVDIANGRIRSSNLITTSEEISQAYRRTILQEHDLVMPLRGKVGEVGIVGRELVGSNLTRGVALLAIHGPWSAQYVKQAISSSDSRARLFQSMNGSALQEVPIATLRAFRIAVPPSKAEQEAIAEALSDADALIVALEQLIAKKRSIKQGVMQALLTGRRRLRGGEGSALRHTELGLVPEDWLSVRWGDVLESCSSGATPYRGRPDFYVGSVRWISSGELNYCVIDETREHISEEAVRSTNLRVHPSGTFLMAITGLEAAGTRGACGIVGQPSTTNQSCMAVYPSSQLLSRYLFHFYVHFGETLALSYCQGTKQQSYTAGLVRKLPIVLPPTTTEQRRIVEVLDDHDAEIEALQARLNKTRQLKQGMAQQLLTGRIRVV